MPLAILLNVLTAKDLLFAGETKLNSFENSFLLPNTEKLTLLAKLRVGSFTSFLF